MSRKDKRIQRAAIHGRLVDTNFRSATTHAVSRPVSLDVVRGMLRKLAIDGIYRDAHGRPDGAMPAATQSALRAISVNAYRAKGIKLT